LELKLYFEVDDSKIEKKWPKMSLIIYALFE